MSHSIFFSRGESLVTAGGIMEEAYLKYTSEDAKLRAVAQKARRGW